MLSVIIPSRVDQFLQQTIDDLLLKAEGEIEVIVAFDGYWPNPMIKDDPRVRFIHHGTSRVCPGMRDGINAGVNLSKGKYIMKIDEHCMVDQGFDLKLIADCTDDMVVIPRRYRLDVDTWSCSNDGRPPIDYMFVAYPYERPYDITCGLHGAEDKQRGRDRKDILIDDTMASQGSCYFMSRKWWDIIGPMDSSMYGTFTHEAQEIHFKTQFLGGHHVVNKKTWYAHFHKGQRGKGYGFSNQQWREHKIGHEMGRQFCIDYWIGNKWEKRLHDFEWLVEQFWPIPTWPVDWKERIAIDALKDYRYYKPDENTDVVS